MTTTPTPWGKMRRFFDWLVKGLDAAAERKCAAHELERVKAEAAAERKGLIDAHERHMQGLQAQIKQLKAEMAHDLAKANARLIARSPEEIAKKMCGEQIHYPEKDLVSINVLLEERLKTQLTSLSVMHNVSVRQLLTGMIALTWPSK